MFLAHTDNSTALQGPVFLLQRGEIRTPQGLLTPDFLRAQVLVFCGHVRVEPHSNQGRQIGGAAPDLRPRL